MDLCWVDLINYTLYVGCSTTELHIMLVVQLATVLHIILFMLVVQLATVLHIILFMLVVQLATVLHIILFMLLIQLATELHNSCQS